MFGSFLGDVVDELQMGDTRMQLLRSKNGKNGKYVVQLWSSLSECWRTMHREADAHEQWLKWKETASTI